MTQAALVSQTPDDLEALFDSIANAPAKVADGKVSPKLAVVNSDDSTPRSDTDKILVEVGHLTRSLHENLRALGYDKLIEKTAAAIPDANGRLAYVISMTEQAAQRALNATDIAKPIQDQMSLEATALTDQWDRLFAKELNLDEFKSLVANTRGYLGAVPGHVVTTNAQLMEIMMAQDFQDLTGQVIRKTTEMIQGLERQLLQLLLDHMPIEKRGELADGLMNGPVISADGRSDIVSNQAQVDDLLDSLGF